MDVECVYLKYIPFAIHPIRMFYINVCTKNKMKRKENSMKKVFAMMITLVITGMFLVSCGKEDPLNRVEAFVEKEMLDGSVEVLGENNGAYEPCYFTTQKAEAEKNKELAEILKKYIVEKIPDEEVEEIFYYVEKIEGEGYIVDIFYQSLTEDNKVFFFSIPAEEEKNQEIYYNILN